MSMPRLKWQLHSIERYDEFAAAWDRVNDATAALPFLGSLFMRPLIKTFATGRERLCVLGEPGQERAVAIVTRARAGAWQTWQPSQLPVGAWLAAKDLSYPEALASLLHALPGFPLLVAATQQDPAVHERPQDGATLRTVDYIETGWIDVRPPFDEYWKSRSKQVQQNVRTQRSKLARENIQTSLEVTTDPASVADAIADYGRLESSGWKGAAGSAVSADNEQGRFYRTVLEEFCRAGTGRIFRYRFGDRVVAVDLCLESRDMQVLLKTTYDESIKGISPSTLMRHEAYRQLFDEGRLRRIEMFGPFMEWTKRWTEQRRRLYHVNRYRSALVPTALASLATLRAALRPRTASAEGAAAAKP